MIKDEDIWAYIYKHRGLSCRLIYKLLGFAGSFESFRYLCVDDLEGRFNDKEISQIIKANNFVNENTESLINEARIFYSNTIKKGISWSVVTSPDYPTKFKTLEDPPTILYYLGHLPNEHKKSVSIIGARECSEYGRKCAMMFARELAMADVQIISGMARGIDGISQRACLDIEKNTFGVLGNGPDVIYPSENRDLYERIMKNGGLLSEYEPGTKPLKQFFPARNRLISGLADMVLVIEARKRSGTYITVTQALEQGRDVWAVPGRITDGLSDGCNTLIAGGAGAALNPDVLLEYLFGERQVMISDYSTEDKSNKNVVISLLRNECLSVEEILVRLEGNIEFDELIEQLTDLQIEGRIKKIGNKYLVE